MKPPGREAIRVLHYVAQHQCDRYGVIVRVVSGEWLIRRGLAVIGARRAYARKGGLCVRLTDEGRKLLEEYK